MSKVQLYVYDLSRGMAKSMSLMLTGKQIDGIWHTSTVVFGREIFFGQGIMEARPGTTHHGPPQQIVDCGATHIDPDTFQEYLTSLQEMYSPSAYHLIDFNCNHFTADVVGFLTGKEIPSWISGLPAEFLSTPFGQAMRPQIDAMFRRTAPTEHPISGSGGPSTLPTPPASGASTPNPLAAGLLSVVAAQATQPAITPSKPSPETSPLTLVSSSSNFSYILKQHSAVVVNFTNTPSCPPCRTIKPVYEAIAAHCSVTYAAKGARFVEVELGIGEGREIASRYKVHATPTFMFFRAGQKVDELKGAAKRELEVKVETFLDECFPRHPHRKLYLPSVEGIPKNPIMSANIPAYPALLSKLESFGADKEKVTVLWDDVVPLLEGKAVLADRELQNVLRRWTSITAELLRLLKPEQTFPIIDLWRVGLVQPRIAAALALNLAPTSPHPVDTLLPILALAARTLNLSSTATPKPFLLTVLRLLTNLLASLPLANLVLSSPAPIPSLLALQTNLTAILVESLLHPDNSVRATAAGVAVNLAAWRHRVAKDQTKDAEEGLEAEWEVEVVSALLEGIAREGDEDVAHRLVVALALFLHLAPGYSSSLQPLLEVLNARETIEGKMKGWKKKEVRKLGEEVATKLC